MKLGKSLRSLIHGLEAIGPAKYDLVKSKRKRAAAVLSSAVEVLEGRQMLSGTPLYWNPSGGSGTWDTDPANTPWHTGSSTGPVVAWDNSGSYQAVFPAGEAGTIDIDSDITVGSISFQDDGYVLTGSDSGYSHVLTFAGDTSQVDVPGGDTAAIDNPIAGSAGLVKTDDGILIFSQSNTYTGGTTVTGGDLQLAGSGTLGNSSNGIELDNGGILDLEGASPSASAISGNGGTIVNTTSLDTLPTSDVTVADGDLSGNVEIGSNVVLYLTGEIDGNLQLDTGAALQVDTGTLTNNGTISWNGANSLQLSNGGSLINDNTMSGYGGQLEADTGCTLINNSQIVVTGGPIDNSFFAPLTNNGTVTLDGDVDLSGQTLTGTYNLDPTDAPSASSGTITLDDAVLNVQSELDLTGGEIDLGPGSTLNVQGTLASSGGTINIDGSSTLDVQGTLAISGGTLTVNDSTFIVEQTGQFNIDVYSDYTATTDSTEAIRGTLSVDGNPIYDPAFGAPTVTQGSPYTLYLGPYDLDTGTSNPAFVTGPTPTDWTVNWGDGSAPETFTNSDPYSYIAATHTYAMGVDTPTLHISATTPAYDDVSSMVLYLPATTIGVTPPVPAGLTATESNAGEVDLSWSYDVNIADDFVVTATDPYGNQTSGEVDANTLNYAFTDLTPDETYTFTVAADAQLYDGTEGESAPESITAVASGTTLTAAGSAEVAENGSGTLTLSSGGNSSTISSWIVNWTDINGISLSTDTVAGSSGTDAYPTPSSPGLVANITANDSAGNSFSLPAFDVTVLPLAPGSVSATSASPNDINLSWTNDSSIATYEQILISTDGSHFSYFDTLDASDTTYTAQGLIPDTMYTFKMLGIDNDGAQSATASATASATTQVDPWHATVTGSATVAQGGTYSLALATDPSSSTPVFNHWTINWGDGNTTTSLTADVTLTHSFASSVTSSKIQVTASTASGASSPLTVTMQPVSVDVIPTAPSELSAVMISATQVNLSWTNNSTIASGYNLLRSLNGGPFTEIDSVDGDTSTYDDTSVNPSDTVEYEVQATATVDTDVSTASTSASLTTPTGVPTLAAALGAAGSESVVLTWSYQGSDDSGFEIEEYDGAVDQNFHTILTPGAVDGTGTGTDTVTGLTGGDTYDFRIRADRSDGSVSGYASGGSVTIPIADAPGLSVESVTITGDDGPIEEIRVGWSGVLSGEGVYIEEESSAIPGNAWSPVWYGDGGSGAWPRTLQGADPDPGSSSDDQGFVIDPGTFGGGSYSYRIASKDAYGNMTAWSEPQSASLGGSAGPSPDVDLDGTDATISWPATDGPQAVLVEADGNAPVIGNGASLPYADYGSLSEDGTTYSCEMDGLLPGTQYDFVLWTPAGTGAGAVPTFGSATVTTEGSAPVDVPATPNNLVAAWAVGGTSGYFLHWQNSSDDETGFHVLRAVNGGAYSLIGSTGADATTYTDTPPSALLPGQSLSYEVESYNDGGASSPASASVSTAPAITSDVLMNGTLQIEYSGPGTPSFFQTIQISGDDTTQAMRDQEMADHGGKDPFDAPVADNPTGNADDPYTAAEITGGWEMQDSPTAPTSPYPPSFVGTESFVVKVKDSAGNLLSTITWQATVDAEGKVTISVTS